MTQDIGLRSAVTTHQKTFEYSWIIVSPVTVRC